MAKRYPAGKTNALATVASSSNPSKRYELRLGADDVAYCTCPAWKFHGHLCKHMIAAAAGVFPKGEIVNGGSFEAVQMVYKHQIEAQGQGYRNYSEMMTEKRAAKKAAQAAAQ